jgi:hypothetical protein
MKRNAIALLFHPYKNCIVPRTLLRESIDRFIETLCTINQQYPQMRFNLVLPAYMLECADPLLIARVRDLCKKSIAEMMCTGYTEPFLSLSPSDLTLKNIIYGKKIIEELTGQTPLGFLPPFSNWEPSLIAHLRNSGFRYALLSNALFSPETRTSCGYWVAEHTGSSIGLIGTNILNTTVIQDGFIEWVKLLFDKNTTPVADPFTVLHYLLPLHKEKIEDACKTIVHIAGEIDKHLLNYQPICLREFLGAATPVGMQYIPTSLQMNRCGTVDLHFLNYLYSFDQIGFMQRKLLDVYERLTPHLENRCGAALLHELFHVQDINRFLPGKESGFEVATDRAATYRRLIATDAKIRALGTHEGARARITDFFHNGGKTIILSNKNCKVFIDPQNGGQITGFDYRPRAVNLCGVYNPIRRKLPDIIVSGASRTWFLDRVLSAGGGKPESSAQILSDTADFKAGSLNYKIRKNTGGINVGMVRNGSFTADEKQWPLTIEKVFGIENEQPELSFVYQLGNPSLITYTFSFAIELHLFLSGIASGKLLFHTGKSKYDTIGQQLLRLAELTEWSIDDRDCGVRLMVQTQKPMTVWCIPSQNVNETPEDLSFVLSSEITLEPSTHYKIVGKIICKSIRQSLEETDAL